MTQDLILRVKYNGTIYDLDVLNDVPLRIDMSTVETGELGRIFGIGSQQFSLPGTKKNNRFFKNGYDISASDIPGMYSPLDAWVIQNGETLLFGALQLEEIVTSDDGYIDYKVSIVDKTIQFNDALKNKFLYEADWSAYQHNLSSGSIISSWSDGLFSGSIFYPVADYGRVDGIDYPTYPRLQLQGTTDGGIGSSNTPLQSRQLLPAIKLKDTLDVIFDQVGFRYTGSFTETADFNNIYMLTKANDDFGPVISGSSLSTFNATEGGQFLDIDNTYYHLTASNLNSDPQGGYDTNTSEYKVQVDGDYDIFANVSFFNPVDAGSDAAIAVRLQLRAGTTSSYTVYDTQELIVIDPDFDGNGPFELSVGAAGVSLSGVDSVFAYVQAEQVAGPGTFDDPMFLSTAELGATAGPINYEGASVDMSQQFNPEFKSEDVIKGMIQQFNLVMIPDQNDQSTIQIEKFDDWLRSGQIKDWTDKYDTNKRIAISSTIVDLPKEVKLQNAADENRFSKVAQEQEPFFPYGTLRLIADSTNAQGDTTIGDVFAPVVLGSVLKFNATGSDGKLTFELDNNGTNQRFVIPHLYKLNNAKQESFAFKPRLGYKVNNNLPSGSSFYVGLPSVNTQISGSYTTLSNLSALPAVSGSTNDLHFNNTYGTFGPAAVLNLNSGNTSYKNYWQTYYESLYWDEGKKVTLDLQFDPYEYKNIKLNDRIVIKNQYYRINKIKGFNVSQRDVVTVELVRLYPAYFQLT